MPWKESSVMDERMRFVIRLKDGEGMASLCREFGISRKTGYKIFERYEQCGLEGLSDRTRRPFRYANQLPEQVEAAIVAAKKEKPHWGARKIRERLIRWLPHAVKVPAASTVHAVLDRHGLVRSPARSRPRAEGTPWSDGLNPNDLWSTDYKGEFQLADKRYCYPLTVTTPRVICCCARHSNRTGKSWLSVPSSVFSERGVYQGRSALTTVFPLPLLMGSFSFRNSRSGGYGWESRSSGLSQVIRSRTAAMNACI
jgi:transposase